MNDTEKFIAALNTLKSGVEYTYDGDPPITEELFNNIKWNVGENEQGAIQSTTCPHSEITWTLFKTEYDKL
jgi:hypothetical protein